MYRADVPRRALGVASPAPTTEVSFPSPRFQGTGDLIKYGELIDPYEPAGKKTQKVKSGGKD